VIPYGRQTISEDDIEAVVSVLRGEMITQGPAGVEFEAALAERAGAGHAVAVNSGTSALHVACRALGVGPGSLVWTSPISFVASANCARYCGAEVSFVDVEPESGNLSVPALRDALEEAHAAGRLPDVVIPVDFAGHPCDLAGIAELAEAYGFRIVRDASHSLGAQDALGRVGADGSADVTVFSFHPVKLITTGEGGAAVTADAELAERMARLRSHGITRDPARMQSEPDGGWYYEQLELGFNYRMTDIQAALGRSQLERLEGWIADRNRLADRYDRLLAELPLDTPPRPALGRSAFHLYVARLPDAERRRTAFDRLRAAGYGVNVHYIPIHLQPYYRALGFEPGMYPRAEAFYASALSLPLFPGLAEAEQDRVAGILQEAVGAGTA
jgi:UDP-4-amino-4,6-dideoxy-N-acetyl-beta-L-altrosamine transaminase